MTPANPFSSRLKCPITNTASEPKAETIGDENAENTSATAVRIVSSQ